MSQEADDLVDVRDFPGLVLNADPNDVPEGASRAQVNAQSGVEGQLDVRLGFKLVTFEN